MADGIRIKIGASVDGSVSTAFKSVEQRATQAQTKVRAEAKKTTTAIDQETRKQLQAQQRLTRAAEALDRQRHQGLYRQFRQQEAAANRAAAAQERAQTRAAQAAERAQTRAQEKIRRELEKTVRAAERAAERERRATHGRNVRAGESFARRTSHRATRFLAPEMPLTSLAAGAGRSVANGLGIDTTFSGSLARTVSLEQEAAQLANQERIATGSTRGGKHFERLARSTADATSGDPASSLRLASRFAAKTGTYGNLDSIVPQLASLAKASGADYEQVGEAAGMVFQQMRNEADPIQATLDTLRAIIGQSAEGAVDMPDYAKQLGRVAAGAFKFDGDRSKNVAALSALTQIAMERGATSPADAARSTSSFVSTLGKGARLAQFEAAGVPIYKDDVISDGKAIRDGRVIPKGEVAAGEKRNTLRPLDEIIKDSFRATEGNIPMLGKMYMDVLGRKGVESLGSEYQAAGGGEAGIKAIEKVFDRYMNATLTKETEQQNLKDVEGTAAAKAQKFQNNLDKIVNVTAEKLLPAMEKLAPGFLKIAEVLGSTATWIAENPKSAVAIGIGGTIARAGLESYFRGQIEAMILGKGGANAATVGTAVSRLGGSIGRASLVIGAALAGFEATKAIIGEVGDASDEKDRKNFKVEADASNAGNSARASLERAKALADAGHTEEAQAELDKARANAGKAITGTKTGISEMEDRGGILRFLGDNLLVPLNEREGVIGDRDKREANELALRKKDLAELERLMDNINGTLAGGINVNNMPDAPPPGRASNLSPGD